MSVFHKIGLTPNIIVSVYVTQGVRIRTVVI